jgi:hypothetical protein
MTNRLQQLRISQVKHTKECTLLVYSRERSNTIPIARKLRAIFHHVYCTSEVKDSQRIIAKFSHDVVDPKPIVDVVCYDITACFSLENYISR